jgi:aryl-alcohol dehydrogenase-like predicted oxidoreductase
MTIMPATMERRPFGATGLSVSTLGFGSAPIGLLAVEQERANAVLNQLLDSGVNLIDTAASYKGSEEMLGKAIGPRRDQVVLVSKCGQAFDDLPGEAWSAQVVAATVDRALRRLKTDHLDVMLLHSCKQEVLEKGEALGALVKAKDAGKIRFAGYSGDNEAAEYAAKLADVAVIEASFNIVDQANIARVLPIAQKRNLGVIAKRPLANAAWKPLDEQPGFYANYARDYHDRFKAMGLSLADLGAADWSELAVRYTLSIPGIHTAIIGTTNPKNAQHNAASAAKGPLSKKAIDTIAAAFTKAGGEKWPALG